MERLRHGDVDQPAAFVKQTVQLRGCFMAENRPGPDTQHSGPQHGRARWLTGKGRIDAELEALPAPIAYQVLDLARTDPGCLGLPVGNHPALARKQPCALVRQLLPHTKAVSPSALTISSFHVWGYMRWSISVSCTPN